MLICISVERHGLFQGNSSIKFVTLLRCKSSIDRKYGSSNEASLMRGKKAYSCSDFPERSKPTPRILGQRVRQCPLVMQVRLEARCDGIYHPKLVTVDQYHVFGACSILRCISGGEIESW